MARDRSCAHVASWGLCGGLSGCVCILPRGQVGWLELPRLGEGEKPARKGVGGVAWWEHAPWRLSGALIS